MTMPRWVMEATGGIDYFMVAGATPAKIRENYINATAHPPLLPDFALGFWQSKLRYRTQEELLGVVHEYKKRDLPLAVFASEYFSWPLLGGAPMDPRFLPHPVWVLNVLIQSRA